MQAIHGEALTMSATFPLAFVMILCKTIAGGPDGDNSDQTHWQNRDWDMTGGVMHCRRVEVQVTPVAETQGQEAPPWTPDACWRTALTLGPKWDDQHPNSPYRFWRVACPVKIVNPGPDGIPGTPDDEIVGWKLPECPYKDGTVDCEVDSAI